MSTQITSNQIKLAYFSLSGPNPKNTLPSDTVYLISEPGGNVQKETNTEIENNLIIFTLTTKFNNGNVATISGDKNMINECVNRLFNNPLLIWYTKRRPGVKIKLSVIKPSGRSMLKHSY